MAKLKVLIVGAGGSGLPAIKCCLDDGLEPVCVERTGDIGGLWNYENSLASGDDVASVMRSTIINTSKEMMCYSDFPIPAEYPNYMHNKFVLKYLRLYADRFKLNQHIQLNTEVVRLKPVEDFANTGRWEAIIRNRKTGEQRTEIFDATMICTGHHADKKMARFDGEENFKGTRVHTHDFHDSRGYDNKRVVVVGIGNSGGDVAVELSRICSQVYLSTRRGTWILNRIAKNGLPVDHVLTRRVMIDLNSLMPRSLANTLIERDLNSKFDHALYGLKPDYRYDNQHPTVSDDLPNAIAAGRVIMKPNIRRVTETGVEFDDGSVVDDIDVIIYATGYVFGFPFIDHEALEVVNNEVKLFKFVFPPVFRPSTLAVIGCFQPLGAIFPISETQCRWAVRVFKGETPLPSSEDMWKDIKLKKDAMAQRYYASTRHTIQVDYIPYIDEIAELAGCRPNLFQILKSDPLLAYHMYFGPMTSIQLRVMGHGAWSGARETILTTWKRIQTPFETRKVSNRNDNSSVLLMFQIAFVVLLLLFLYSKL